MSKISTFKLKKIAVAKSFNDSYISLSSGYLALISYKGVNAANMALFRKKLFTTCNLKMNILKNKVQNFSITGTNFSSASNNLKGQIGSILCTEDQLIEVAKLLSEFCKTSEKDFSFIGIFSAGDTIDLSKLKFLSSLPGLDILRATLLATMNSVASSFVRTLSEPMCSSLRLMKNNPGNT